MNVLRLPSFFSVLFVLLFSLSSFSFHFFIGTFDKYVRTIFIWVLKRSFLDINSFENVLGSPGSPDL